MTEPVDNSQRLVHITTLIDEACANEFSTRLGNCCGLSLTADDSIALTNEVMAGVNNGLRVTAPSDAVYGVKIGSYVNPVTREVMRVEVVPNRFQSSVLVRRPSSLAWTDKKKSRRRPAKRSAWINEWVTLRA